MIEPDQFDEKLAAVAPVQWLDESSGLPDKLQVADVSGRIRSCFLSPMVFSKSKEETSA